VNNEASGTIHWQRVVKIPCGRGTLASISRLFRARESRLMAYSARRAFCLLSADQDASSTTGPRPRAYFAPAPALCAASHPGHNQYRVIHHGTMETKCPYPKELPSPWGRGGFMGLSLTFKMFHPA